MKNILLLNVILLLVFQSCQKDGLSDAADSQMTFLPKLADYNIYKDNLRDLIPNDGFRLYQLGSSLFTDFSEKQRLIKVPSGTQLKFIDNGLPNFPDGTIIVKTFYYFNDKRDASKGKRIIETRLLIKEAGVWNVADYLWNEEQTDATLIEDGINTMVNYINENGQGKVIAYHVPSNRECATCHLKNETIVPIGPKLRNLNLSVETPLGTVNQLSYFQDVDLLEKFDLSTLVATPDYHNPDVSTELRARAYLDINCGHCHKQDGFAADEGLMLSYEVLLDESKIRERKRAIVNHLKEGEMPSLGTTVLDEKGIELIEEFINSL